MVGTIGVVASNQLTQEYTRILSQSNVALSGVRPSYVNQLKQDRLVKSLKQDGSWNLIDVLYMFANDESTGNFALLNWTNPSLYSLTKINSPTFISNRGYTGGTNVFLSSSWSPSQGVNFLQNSASFGGMIYNNAIAGILLGNDSGSGALAGQSPVYLVPRVSSTYRYSLNSSRIAPTVPQNFMGRRVLGVFRSSSATVEALYPSSSTVDGFVVVGSTSLTRTTLNATVLQGMDLNNRLFGANNTASMAWWGGYGIRDRISTFTGSMTTYINSI